MDADPELVDRLHEDVRVLVRDDTGGVPPGTTTQHVEDDMLVDKQQITFHLIVESVGYLNTAHIVRSWFAPFMANLASLHNLG